MILNYGLTSWAPFYAVVTYKLPLARVGLEMGIVAASAGLIGTYFGGVLADWARRYSPRGRLYVSFVAMIGSVPIAPLMFAAPTLEIMLAWWLLLGTIVHRLAAGMAAATQELVLPRMRGTAAAALTLGMTMFGLGLGPLQRRPRQRRDRRPAFSRSSASMPSSPLLALCMLVAIRHVAATEANLVERARAAGEPIAATVVRRPYNCTRQPCAQWAGPSFRATHILPSRSGIAKSHMAVRFMRVARLLPLFPTCAVGVGFA